MIFFTANQLTVAAEIQLQAVYYETAKNLRGKSTLKQNYKVKELVLCFLTQNEIFQFWLNTVVLIFFFSTGEI